MAAGERVKTWLANKGIGELSDEQTARAIVRALKAGKTADETVPMLISKGSALFNTADSSADESAEENSNLAARYNLTDEPIEGISRERATDAINQFFGTKHLPARILVTRNRAVPWETTALRNGSIAVNAAKLSSSEQVPRAILRGSLSDILVQPTAQRAWRYVDSYLTTKELNAALNRRKSQGLPTNFSVVRQEAAIARVINSNGRDRVVENFYNAIRAAFNQKFRLNLPATAHPQLKQAVTQLLRERSMQGKRTAGTFVPDPAKARPLRNVLKFKRMEVRAVRDLSHLKVGTLRLMARYGFAGRTKNGNPISLHHLTQNPKGPLVEMPGANNKISNISQHPFGNTPKAGLSKSERIDYNAWRDEYWRWRAIQELAARAARGQ